NGTFSLESGDSDSADGYLDIDGKGSLLTIASPVTLQGSLVLTGGSHSIISQLSNPAAGLTFTSPNVGNGPGIASDGSRLDLMFDPAGDIGDWALRWKDPVGSNHVADFLNDH